MVYKFVGSGIVKKDIMVMGCSSIHCKWGVDERIALLGLLNPILFGSHVFLVGLVPTRSAVLNVTD